MQPWGPTDSEVSNFLLLSHCPSDPTCGAHDSDNDEEEDVEDSS